MSQTHQPDEDRFHAIRAEDIEWKTFAAYPPGVRMAVIVGDPAKPGPCVIRVKVPMGARMMPHKHPEDRIYTVMSGVFYIGLGRSSTRAGSPPSLRGASLSCPAARPISTGPDPASAWRK